MAVVMLLISPVKNRLCLEVRRDDGQTITMILPATSLERVIFETITYELFTHAKRFA